MLVKSFVRESKNLLPGVWLPLVNWGKPERAPH